MALCRQICALTNFDTIPEKSTELSWKKRENCANNRAIFAKRKKKRCVLTINCRERIAAFCANNAIHVLVGWKRIQRQFWLIRTEDRKMPLVKSASKAAFRKNVAAERKAGKPMKQSLAIAYSVKRKAQGKKRK